MLFTGTVLDNIVLGRTGITMEVVEDACRSAGAHGFIQDLPRGYMAWIGGGAADSGARLSGGQKQRIAIARCIVTNPR